MTSIRAKIFEVFRNIKSDAVPRPPRPTVDEPNDETPDQINEDVNSNSGVHEEEETVFETEKPKASEKKSKKSFFKPEKKKDDSAKKKERKDSNSTVNTQATGNVINIVNSKDVRWGNEFVYHLGPTNSNNKQQHSPPEDHIEKDNLIYLLLEANIEPRHEYIDYISKNLGKNWHTFFRALGYTQGRIETVEIDEIKNGVSEARYKLLLDWIRNEEDNTLGRLATYLWEEGERHIVKALALIYKNNK